MSCAQRNTQLPHYGMAHVAKQTGSQCSSMCQCATERRHLLKSRQSHLRNRAAERAELPGAGAPSRAVQQPPVGPLEVDLCRAHCSALSRLQSACITARADSHIHDLHRGERLDRHDHRVHRSAHWRSKRVNRASLHHHMTQHRMDSERDIIHIHIYA